MANGRFGIGNSIRRKRSSSWAIVLGAVAIASSVAVPSLVTISHGQVPPSESPFASPRISNGSNSSSHADKKYPRPKTPRELRGNGSETDFTDGEFLNWTDSHFSTPGFSSAMLKFDSDGNPGAHIQSTTFSGYNFGDFTNHFMLNNDVYWNPIIDGAIAGVQLGIDVRGINSAGDGQAIALLVSQGGKLFISPPFSHVTGPAPSWYRITLGPFSATEFVHIYGPHQMDATTHPEFDAVDSRLKFGFAVANHRSDTKTHKYDNWAITISKSPEPDLVITKIDTSGLVGDWQALTVSGEVSATIKNVSDNDVTRPFEVTFFEDYTFDGKFDPGSDNILSTATVSSLAAGASTIAAADMRGSVLFRDNLIYAIADSDHVVFETDENNNVSANGKACRNTPVIEDFRPKLKWSWPPVGGSTVLPNSRDVASTPAIIDVDLDGTPDIVFTSSATSATGHLRAIRGTDGAELFTTTSPTVHSRAPITAGDLNGDRFPEFMVSNASRLLCFSHTGTFLWQSPLLSGISYGAASIADIDQDGLPEIVVGRQVLRASDGSIRWSGTGGTGNGAHGPLSLVADIDLDGMPNIVGGNTCYKADGSLLWRNASLPDGYNALGNFDVDPFPEIVLVNGKVWLLNHDGSVVWGPVAIPGGGTGGPPTVADFDGDGLPEIGVAGATRYFVLETNGALKWQSTTRDGSSSATGSSVFDFEGDGSAEVLYRDELKFRVYRGNDGAILFEVPMSSGTVLEYPLVADVDGDGAANIVAIADRINGFGPQYGLFVFESESAPWIPTRKIWNQHTYHVTNINDDGTIPRFEANSWLYPLGNPYNAYRQNILTGNVPLAAPDLTASYLRFACDGDPKYLTARIGNGGAVGVDAGVPVSFYDDDPRTGGQLLGTVNTTFPMPPGLFEDVTLQVASGLDCTHETYAVANDSGSNLIGAIGTFKTFSNKADFLSTAAATAAPPWPNLGLLPAGPNARVILGDFTLSISPSATQLYVGWPDDVPQLDGHQISISGPENLNVDFSQPLNAFGFDFFEPTTDHNHCGVPNVCPCFDSNFRVDIFSNGTFLNSFEFNVPDNVAAFVGFYSIVPFDRLEIRDVTNTCDDELFGRFYVGSEFVWKPSTITAECNEDNNIHHAGIDALLERLVDITTSIETDWRNTTYNRTTQTLLVHAAATNIGDLPLRGPILMVIDSMWDAGVSVQNPDGFTSDGKPYFVFTDVTQTSSIFKQDDEIGEHRIIFDDALGPQPRFTFSWRAALDEAPIFVSVPSTEGVVGQEYQYQAKAVDPNGDTLTYAIDAGPIGLEIGDETGLVRWLPSEPSSQNIIISVDDGFGGRATQRFALNILSEIPNRPPVFSSGPVTRAPMGGAYDYQATAIDPDGDDVTFSGTGPDGLSVPANGAIHWDFALPPAQPVIVIADDGNGGQTEQHFSVTVGEVSDNPGAPNIFGTPGVIAAVGKPYVYQPTVSDPDSDSVTCKLLIAPTGMAIDENTCRISWTPTSAQVTVPPELGQQVTLVASDRPENGNAAVQTWKIKVLESLPNAPPVVLSLPNLVAETGSLYEYQVIASDPEGQALQYELVNPPAGMAIDPDSGLITWNPTAPNSVPLLVAIKVTDSLLAYGSQVYPLQALPPNIVPVLAPIPDAEVAVGATFRYQLEASDENGDPLKYVVLDAPDGMTVNEYTGQIMWTPQQSQLGSHDVRVGVRDGRAPAVEESFTLTVTTDMQPPGVSIIILQARVVITVPGNQGECDAANPSDSPEGAILVNYPATFCVLASDNVGVVARTLAMDGAPLTLDNRGCAEIIPDDLHQLVFTATATDAAGNTGTATRNQPVGPGSEDTTAVVTLISPAPEAVITSAQEIRVKITAEDPAALDRYCVQVAPAGSNEFKSIGDGPLSGNFEGVVATFDPTKLPNDAYIVQIRVYDRVGNYTGIEFALNVSGEYKSGRFTTTFTDLTVPVGGIPLTVSRIYDSFDPRPGDFGPGWRLGLPGKVTDTARENPPEGLRANSRIYVTRPDGKRVGFKVFAVPTNFLFPYIAKVFLIPEPGVTDSLDVPGGLTDQFLFGGVLYAGFGDDPFNPRTYVLKSRNGIKYTIDEIDGLRKIEDLNGNTVTVSRDGIVSSKGPGISFVRDAKGRITRVVEPDDPADGVAPAFIRYEYDAISDNLVHVYDQKNNKTDYEYTQPGFPHLLTEIIDPLGRRGIRSVYDDDGRLIAQCDATSAVSSDPLPDPCDDTAAYPTGCIRFCNTTNNRQEVVTDRLGFSTILEYDERGNVVKRTDSYGKVTNYEFDANDRLKWEEDCAGRVKEYTYNDRGDILTETNCSGGVTVYTRNSLGQPLTRRDALGNITTYEYDNANGNLMKEIAPDGGVTTHTYFPDGQIKTTTNPLNKTEFFEYDGSGRMTAQVDFAGARTEYTYNAFGDRMTETKLRRLTNGTVERITTKFFYDENHREVRVEDTYGYSTKKEYDAAGQLKKTIDQFDRVTENFYDVLGNLEEVRYPDGTSESYTYDPEGRRDSLTNRDQHTTRYEYDRLGRLVKTIHPDGTLSDTDNPFTEIAYDCVGRILTQWDERRNATQYDYDCSPNTQVVTDALLNDTEHEFDLNGNRVRMTDALLHTTRYLYDSMGRQIRTIYHDNTFSETKYDKGGRKTRDIDPDNKKTDYEHDEMDRLTAVTLYNDNVPLRTEYTYDELGNQITQKDAEERVTHFEYDRLSRRTKRILPLGQTEVMTYDRAGRMETKTDFNGDTIVYTYDTVGRLTRETTPDGGYYQFAYNGLGKRTLERIVEPGQPAKDTIKDYDARGRLITVDNPDGSSLEYDYDDAGNRTLLIATTPQVSQTTTFDFDALNRLEHVHHPDNGGRSTYTYDKVGNRKSLTLPNATVATYEYDDLNRLTVLTNARSDQSIISRYAYTLSPSGQRTRVDETTPQGNQRVVEYDYDDVYRLTGETITDPENADLDISYVYDKVGNRKLKTLVGPGGTSDIVYAYDDNDRLTVETETVRMAEAVDRQSQYYASLGILPPTRANYVLSRGLLTLTGLMVLWPLVPLLPRKRGMGRAARMRNVRSQTICLVLLAGLLLDGQSAQMLHYSANVYAVEGDVNTAGTSTTPTTYSYDDNGNTKTRTKNTQTDRYEWDFRNRLVGAQNRTENNSDTTFSYDVDGIRVAKGVAGESATKFIADKNRDYAQVTVENELGANDAERLVTYTLGAELLTSTDSSSGTIAFHFDGQMSTRQLTASTGSVSDVFTYDAFGNVLRRSGVTSLGFLFSGAQYDANLGFYYLRARYYSHDMGRFLSKDPYIGSNVDPKSLHKYLYVSADPINNWDPSGQMAADYAINLTPAFTVAPGLLQAGIALFFAFLITIAAIFVGSLLAEIAQRLSPCGLSPYQVATIIDGIPWAFAMFMMWWKLYAYFPTTQKYAAEHRADKKVLAFVMPSCPGGGSKSTIATTDSSNHNLRLEIKNRKEGGRAFGVEWMGGERAAFENYGRFEFRYDYWGYGGHMPRGFGRHCHVRPTPFGSDERRDRDEVVCGFPY